MLRLVPCQINVCFQFKTKCMFSRITILSDDVALFRNKQSEI